MFIDSPCSFSPRGRLLHYTVVRHLHEAQIPANGLQCHLKPETARRLYAWRATVGRLVALNAMALSHCSISI